MINNIYILDKSSHRTINYNKIFKVFFKENYDLINNHNQLNLDNFKEVVKSLKDKLSGNNYNIFIEEDITVYLLFTIFKKLKKKEVKISSENHRQDNYCYILNDYFQNDLEKIAKFIKFNNMIQKIEIENFYFELKYNYKSTKDKDCIFQIFLNALISNQNIKELKFSNNNLFLYPFSVKISNIIKSIRNLSSIDINSDQSLGINKESLFVLYDSLDFHTQLREISFWKCDLGRKKENIKSICQIIKNNIFLEKINLSFNKLWIFHENLKFIEDAILEGKNINEVNLDNNFLGEENCFALSISRIIKESKALRILSLNNNCFIYFEKNKLIIDNSRKFNQNIVIYYDEDINSIDDCI